MKVLKFGGSSVGNAERINSVVMIIQQELNKKEKIAIIFSAFQTVTDKLIEISNLALNKEIRYR
ncbi:MAG: hypothetical protein K9I99_14700, partial [Melioribacteraceae bacterium]|nr:hypothetical protein [Melioribacteraceae bacterium]